MSYNPYNSFRIIDYCFFTIYYNGVKSYPESLPKNQELIKTLEAPLYNEIS